MSRRGSHSSESSRGEDLWPSLRPTPETTSDTTSATAVESFPSMKLPPNGFLVKDHKELETYLQSSPELFEAYVSEFGIRVQKDSGLSIDDTVQFEPLKQWVGYNSSIHRALIDVRPELADYFCQMVFMKSADMIGVMFLNKVFDGWMTQNEISSQSPDDVKKEASRFYEAAMGLHETVVAQPRAPAAVGLDKAFDARYMDPHHMLNYYASELEKMCGEWFETKGRYMAPYTSIVTSSMMGKTRLIKEISSFIPTIYLCLRESKERSQLVDGEQFVDGYPDRSSEDVIRYLFHDNKDVGEEELERHYVCFVIGVLEAVAFWLQSQFQSESPIVETPNELNECLWKMLAEPSKLEMDQYSSLRFWRTATKNARSHYSTSKYSDLKVLLQDRWNALREPLLELNLLGKEPKFPLLLFCFDEARALVKIGLGGKQVQNEEEISRFRILRRAIRQIGMLQPPIRIFTVFTDTTSKISNFQPNMGPHSVSTAPVQRRNDLFPPIVILPTFDYHANNRLAVTNDALEVSRPDRLFCFGRSAWFSMLASGTPYKKLVALAEAKLTRRDADSLRRLFQGDPLDEASRLIMLALMGTRLALQTGSFTALLPEMVSSHLMVLMRVSNDHEQLEAFYPSEPILANASANITSQLGWTRPCQAMVSLFRHGMVEKGFRGEYVTKALCCIAFEDACRELKQKEELSGEDHEILWYSRPVPVFSFLNRLLRHPLDVHTDDDDDDDDDDSSSHATKSMSSTVKGKVSESKTGKKRRLTDIPEVDEGQAQSPPQKRQRLRKEPDISPSKRKKRQQSLAKKPMPRRAGAKRSKLVDFDDPDIEPTDDFFDDWVSDEDDLPNIQGEDKVAAEQKTGIDEYFLSALSEWYDMRPQTKKATRKGKGGESQYDRCLKDLDVLQKGTVFLTHWVSLKSKLRPSTLIKAWNRGAGIMTRANTGGIDFIIPIMRGVQVDKSLFGPLFGKWTVDQEKAASQAIAYILIDAKNDASLSINDIIIQATKCAPSASNFKCHQPLNPFLSIIASYATSDIAEPVKLLRDVTIDTNPTCFSIAAQGLSGATFKCLQKRPNLTKILKATLEMDRNPLRGTKPQFEGFRNTMRDYYHLAVHPGREFNFYEAM